MKKTLIFLGLCCLAVLCACTRETATESPAHKIAAEVSQALTPGEARAIAREAYVYGFPMVVNYKTMYVYSINKQSPEYKGPFNCLGCEARLYTPEDKAIVTPNADTPYCMFWADLSREPVVISVPDMEPERFYHFQLIDLYTHNFAYIGTLTTGNKAGNYLIAGPDWKGAKPDGIDEVFQCETDYFFSVVRTQLFNPEDMANVKAIQDAFALKPLSAFMGTASPAAAAAPHFPEWREGDQFNAGAFTYLNVMLKLVKPVDEEKELMRRFARINIGGDQAFDITAFPPDVAEAIEAGVKDGFKDMEAFIAKENKDPLGSAKIFGTRAFLAKSAADNYGLKDFYVMRAVAAHTGLYGNSGAEALYPLYAVDSTGHPLNATAGKYSLTFTKENLPPVKSFWSLSMYDGRTQLFIHNPLNRYLLNSTMMDRFQRKDDGSVTFYIQKDSPGKELESNWLPAPEGPFYMVMRLYGPEAEALSGKWMPPKLDKVD